MAPRSIIPLAAATAAAAVAFALSACGAEDPPTATERETSRVLFLVPVDTGAPRAAGLIRLDAGDRGLRLAVSGLSPSGRDSHYQLWALEPTIGLGSFSVPASGEARVTMPLPDGVPAAFDVSVEPRDGNPAYSGVSVLGASAR